MHPTELWWLIDGKRPPKMYGSLTEDDVLDLYDELEAAGEDLSEWKGYEWLKTRRMKEASRG